MPDVAGSYADRIREIMQKQPDRSFTVPELRDELKCQERRIREGLDRLAFLRQVRVQMRHTPGQRGMPPRAYVLIPQTAAQ